MPKRIQLRRTKGWRKPIDAIVVARPTKWGNPFNWKIFGKAKAAKMFENWITGPRFELDDKQCYIQDHLHELRGKDLCCWCSLNEPCHADILLKLANQ